MICRRQDPILSGPTQEIKPRVELCARTVVDGKKKRVHVYTTTESAWGPNFFKDMKTVKAAIEANAMTKKAALALRDSLRP